MSDLELQPLNPPGPPESGGLGTQPVSNLTGVAAAQKKRTPREESALRTRRLLIAFIIIAVIVLIVVIVRKRGGTGTGTYVVDADLTGDRLRPGSHPDSLRYFVGDDPTGGLVDYDKWTDLITYDPSSERTIMKVSGPGDTTSKGRRRSLRLVSKNRYDTGLFVISADHIPEGMGTWPAFWLTAWEPSSNAWACHGEIDIIEGVNSVDAGSSKNAMTLHTSDSSHSNCRQAGVPGITNGGNCSASNDLHTASGCGKDQHGPNLGCGVVSKSNKTFGVGFNQAGGGVYATELLPNGAVTIWFFPKGSEPDDIAANKPEPSKWPAQNIAVAFKPCPGSFAKMQMILNTTLCGGWAGQAYRPGGATKCNSDLVNSDLSKAYWSIEYIKAFRRRDAPGDVTPEPQPWYNYSGGHTACGSGGTCPSGQKCVGGLCTGGGGGPHRCTTAVKPTADGGNMFDNPESTPSDPCCSPCENDLSPYLMLPTGSSDGVYMCYGSDDEARQHGKILRKGGPPACPGGGGPSGDCCSWTSGTECTAGTGRTGAGIDMYSHGCCTPCQSQLSPYLIQLGGSGPGKYYCFQDASAAAAGGNTVLGSGPTCS